MLFSKFTRVVARVLFIWDTWKSGGSDGKKSTHNVGDLGLIPGLGRSPGGGHGNLLQYFCLENPHGQRSLAGYRPKGCKESDTTYQLSTAQRSGSHRDRKNGVCKGWGNGWLLFNGDKVKILHLGRVMGMDGGDSCTIFWISLSCIL